MVDRGQRTPRVLRPRGFRGGRNRSRKGARPRPAHRRARRSPRGRLPIQNPPNNGTLVSVGALGVDVGDNAGFDISAVDGVAYAALQVAPSVSSGLYRIDLTTGRATLVGRIGGGAVLRALAAADRARRYNRPDARGGGYLSPEGRRPASEWSDASCHVFRGMHHHRSHPPRNAAGRRRQAGDQGPRRHDHASRPVLNRREEAARGEPAAQPVPRRHRRGRGGQLGDPTRHASR